MTTSPTHGNLLCTGLGNGFIRAIQQGARLRAGLLGCGGVASAICCVMVARRLSNYIAAWEEFRRMQCDYRQLSIRLKYLIDTVEEDLK